MIHWRVCHKEWHLSGNSPEFRKYPICIVSSIFNVCLSFTKQVQWSKLNSEKLCTFVIGEQSKWSRKISLAITRQITQEDKFITHKNNCYQVFSRSRNDQPKYINECKLREGWQSSSLKKMFWISPSKTWTSFQQIQTILHDFLQTCEYFNLGEL